MLVTGDLAQGENRLEHLVERHRIDGDDLGTASQMVERLIDVGDIDRAHRAQILSDDHIGVEVAQGALIEGVQVLTRRDAGPHLGVDLRGGQP